MDRNNIQDYKQKPNGKQSDMESKVFPSNSSNQLHGKTVNEQNRNVKKRPRTPTKEGETDCSSDDRNKMKVKEEQAITEEQRQSNLNQQFQSQHQALHQQQLQQMSQQPLSASFPAYGYGIPDQFNVDVNQPSYPMMAPFNMYPMNHQWPGNQMEMSLSTMTGNSNLSVSTGMEMTPNSNANMNPYPTFMPMHGELYGMMNGMGNYCPFPMFPPEPMISPVKEIIKLPSCTLYPPHPGQIIKTRARHPGCKTVFCGGLPEKITEEIIREVFSRCGEICTIRMSKKNFCHIRFAEEYFVDQAMQLSGYRMKIENKDDSEYSGRLHVDFAKARDDAYDFECLQRSKQREARHRARLEQEALRPPTPPPVVHYSDHESMQLTDKLKSEDQSKAIAALHVLNTWLERGECNRKHSGQFFSLVSCVIYAAKRLLNEKRGLMRELNDTKTQMQQKMTLISLCFHDIHKVFETVQKSPKIWETFSKSHKKEIETLGEKSLDVLKSHSKEMVDERVEDEMDLSDGEGNAEKPTNKNFESKKVTKEELSRLKKEMDGIRNQYDIALHENERAKRERISNKIAYEEMYEEIQGKVLANQAECKELQKFKDNSKSQKFEIPANETVSSNNDDDSFSITQHEILLITSISTFLTVHPFGASIDYICSYLFKFDNNITRTGAERLLKNFPNLFKEFSSGVGATLVKTWKFVGYTE